MGEKTIFSKIIDGEIPANILYEDDMCIAINDVNPQSEVHVLVIPRKPIPRLCDASDADKALLGHLLWVAPRIAEEQGVGDGFRLIINNGANAGQTVFHLHLHILGGTFREHGLV